MGYYHVQYAQATWNEAKKLGIPVWPCAIALPVTYFRALCLALGVWIGLSSGGAAQDADAPVLRVPWTQSAGFGFLSDTGEVRSYAADLARMIAEEAGFSLRFERYDSAPEVIAAMRDGRADLLASVGRLPTLEASSLFSAPVAETQLLLYLRSDAPNDWSFETFQGRRIGGLRGTSASRQPLPDGAEFVPFDDQITAFAKLLVGEIDGVIVAHALGERTLRTAGIEPNVRPSFPPVAVQHNHVALNRAQGALMPRIEAALDRLESSGALVHLADRWFMLPPVPVPDRLTVGVTQFPPYQVVTEEGAFTGFAVEVLRGLAARSDIELAFEEVTLESWARGPRPGGFDLVPARSINADETQWLQFSLPIQTFEYATFVSAETSLTAIDPARHRIGILSGSPIRDTISATVGGTLIPIGGAVEGADALARGDIDALIFPSVSFEASTAAQGREDRFRRLEAPVFNSELAVAMRPGLGDLEQRLNVVIPGFLGSLEYRTLVQEWIETPRFWTPHRVRLLIIAAAAVAVLGLAAFLIQNWRARRVAERLRAEAVSASERLSAILTSTRHAIFGFDAQGQIAVINPSGRALLSLPQTEGAGQWPDEAVFLDPMTGAAFAPEDDPLRRVLRGEMLKGPVYLFQPATDAKPHFVRVSSDRVTDTRTALATLLIIEDDNDNELTRQKLDRSHRLSSLGLLTGGLAHDFNNILATVLYNAQMARIAADGRMAKVLDRIIDTVGQGSDLSRRLLSFARQTPQPVRAVNLAASLQELAALSHTAIGEAIDLVIPDIADDLFAYCDPGELENALLNLVLNARDAMVNAGCGDQIAIQVRTYDWSDVTEDGAGVRPTVEISVSDNGPGMSESVRRRAADPFFSTKTGSGGTGLGLAMVESFAARASGHLSIYSELGHGTTVRLRLPRVCAEGDQIVETPSGPLPRGNGERILLVEDQAALREPMAELLRELGYGVETAATGPAALATIEHGATFDLVLSDIVMPGGMSGLDLARALRQRCPEMAVILMTGFADAGSEEMTNLKVQVLQKPCPVPELARAIAAALQQQARGG